MNNNKRGWWCALPLAACATSPTWAAEKAAPQEESLVVVGRKDADGVQSYQPLTSVTGTRSETNLLNVPQAIDVVPQQVITDQAVSSLDEALYNVSGITQANTLGGTQDAVMIRRQPRRLHSARRRALGAGAQLYADHRAGGGAQGAGLDAVRHGRAGRDDQHDHQKPQLQQHTHVEGWGSSFNGGGGQLDVTGPLGTSGFAYRMIVDHDETDYWRNFGRNRQTVIAPSLMWYGENTTVRLAYEHMEYLVPFDRGTIIDSRNGKPVNTPRDRRFDEAYNATRGDQDSVTLQIDQTLNERWKSSLTYAYSRNSYSDNQARATSLNPVSGVLSRQADSTANAVSHANAVQLTLNGDVDWGSINHQMLFGFDFEDNRTYRGDMIRGKRTAISISIIRYTA